MLNLREKFFQKIRPVASGCIEWTAARNAGGYGVMGVGDRRTRLAHHISWFIKYGVWPERLMHTCDNPGCVRLSHLKEGTQAENMADMIAKGRQLKGEQVASAKLTDQQVEYIRDLATTTNITLKDLADQHGVNICTISQIIQGKQRPHSGGPVGRKRFRYDVGDGRRLTMQEIVAETRLSYATIKYRIAAGVTGAKLLAKRKQWTRRT